MATVATQPTHLCSICQKNLTSKAGLVKHERTHTGEKPFNCRLCDSRFRIKSDCRDHEKYGHGPPSLTCDECGKAIRWPKGLRLHKERFHADLSNVDEIFFEMMKDIGERSSLGSINDEISSDNTCASSAVNNRPTSAHGIQPDAPAAATNPPVPVVNADVAPCSNDTTSRHWTDRTRSRAGIVDSFDYWSVFYDDSFIPVQSYLAGQKPGERPLAPIQELTNVFNPLSLSALLEEDGSFSSAALRAKAMGSTTQSLHSFGSSPNSAGYTSMMKLSESSKRLSWARRETQPVSPSQTSGSVSNMSSKNEGVESDLMPAQANSDNASKNIPPISEDCSMTDENLASHEITFDEDPPASTGPDKLLHPSYNLDVDCDRGMSASSSAASRLRALLINKWARSLNLSTQAAGEATDQARSAKQVVHAQLGAAVVAKDWPRVHRISKAIRIVTECEQGSLDSASIDEDSAHFCSGSMAPSMHSHFIERLSDRSVELIIAGLTGEELAELFSVLMLYGMDTEICNSDGHTLLHIASARRSYTGIRLLLDHGASISARTSDGATALHVLCQHSQISLEMLECANVLVEGGIHVDARDSVSGDTALHMLVRELAQTHARLSPGTLTKLLVIIEKFICKGCDVNQRNAAGKTPKDIFRDLFAKIEIYELTRRCSGDPFAPGQYEQNEYMALCLSKIRKSFGLI